MKKTLLALSLLVASVAAHGEGFQVNLQSTKQTGMGHTGVAMRLGAEGMHFNPASLVYIDKMDFSAGLSGVISNVKYDNNAGYTHKSDNPIGTPLFVYAGFNVIKDRLAVGVSLTTPYGSSMKWGNDWAGSSVVQDIALKTYVAQPTVSVKIVDGLSFGAGLTIATGSFDLSRGLISAGALGSFDPSYVGVTPLSANLAGNSSVRLGYNLGLMYEFCDKFSMGVSYRSRVNMKVDQGEAKLTYIDQNAQAIISRLPGVFIPPINDARFNSELPLPSNLTWGVSYKPVQGLILAFDLQYTRWAAYDKLDIRFNETALEPFNMVATKNYKNTLSYRLGGQYTLCEALDLRAGIYYDPTPIRTNHYNPETPGANKVGVSLGASYRPCERMSIDLALLYIDGANTYGEYPTATPVTPTSAPFTGNYKSSAFVPSIGVSYCF